MKKKLAAVILASLTLAVAVPAFASANPFVDVPANHWAYDAVNQLTADGIVDGYGDGTFRGDKNITRYEMAKIVAQALAKVESGKAVSDADKAAVDKLAKEFGDELKNLGVRVAALEAASKPNITWGGELRLRNWASSTDGGDDGTDYRLRLTQKAKVSDDVTVGIRLSTGDTNLDAAALTDTVLVDNVYAATSYRGVDLKAGRFDYKLGQGMIQDNIMNGVTASKGKVAIYLGNDVSADNFDAVAVTVSGVKVGAATLGFNYLSQSDTANETFYSAEAAFDLAKVGVVAQYGKSVDADTNAYRIDAKVNKHWTVGYQQIGAGSITDTSTLDFKNDTKGWDVKYSKELSKNTNLALKYSDMKENNSGAELSKEIRTTVELKF